tara:strand:+ start:1612 stop:1782 length:171 start_codon:yes stop_codon:yes gene_type:complete
VYKNNKEAIPTNVFCPNLPIALEILPTTSQPRMGSPIINCIVIPKQRKENASGVIS